MPLQSSKHLQEALLSQSPFSFRSDIHKVLIIIGNYGSDDVGSKPYAQSEAQCSRHGGPRIEIQRFLIKNTLLQHVTSTFLSIGSWLRFELFIEFLGFRNRTLR
jgi:hypothetical protein